MTAGERKDVLVVVYRSDGPSASRNEQRLVLPAGAGVSDLLRELERAAPAMYAEVRKRILRSAGQVLAYGRDDQLLPTLTRQLAEGGPVVFPADEDLRPIGTSIPGPHDRP